MAVALVNHITAGSTSAGGTSSAVDMTGATILIMNAGYEGAPTISDSLGNTWTALTVRNATASARQKLLYAANPTVGAVQTFAIAGVGTYSAIEVAGFSGVTTSSPLDNNVGADVSNSSSSQPGSMTPTVDGCLIVFGLTWGVNTTDTAPAVATPTMTVIDSVTLSGSHYGSFLAWLEQTTAAAINPTATWSGGTNSSGVTQASFKPSGGGGGGGVFNPYFYRQHIARAA